MGAKLDGSWKMTAAYFNQVAIPILAAVRHVLLITVPGANMHLRVLFSIPRNRNHWMHFILAGREVFFYSSPQGYLHSLPALY